MYDIITIGKTIMGHHNGILEVIKSRINSVVVEGLNNMIRSAFKRLF